MESAVIDPLDQSAIDGDPEPQSSESPLPKFLRKIHRGGRPKKGSKEERPKREFSGKWTEDQHWSEYLKSIPDGEWNKTTIFLYKLDDGKDNRANINIGSWNKPIDAEFIRKNYVENEDSSKRYGYGNYQIKLYPNTGMRQREVWIECFADPKKISGNEIIQSNQLAGNGQPGNSNNGSGSNQAFSEGIKQLGSTFEYTTKAAIDVMAHSMKQTAIEQAKDPVESALKLISTIKDIFPQPEKQDNSAIIAMMEQQSRMYQLMLQQQESNFKMMLEQQKQSSETALAQTRKENKNDAELSPDLKTLMSNVLVESFKDRIDGGGLKSAPGVVDILQSVINNLPQIISTITQAKLAPQPEGQQLAGIQQQAPQNEYMQLLIDLVSRLDKYVKTHEDLDSDYWAGVMYQEFNPIFGQIEQYPSEQIIQLLNASPQGQQLLNNDRGRKFVEELIQSIKTPATDEGQPNTE